VNYPNYNGYRKPPARRERSSNVFPCPFKVVEQLERAGFDIAEIGRLVIFVDRRGQVHIDIGGQNERSR